MTQPLHRSRVRRKAASYTPPGCNHPRIAVSYPVDDLRHARALADKTGQPVAAILRAALASYLRAVGKVVR